MKRLTGMATAVVALCSGTAVAQTTPTASAGNAPVQAGAVDPLTRQAGAGTPVAEQNSEAPGPPMALEASQTGDIIVTATRRSERLSSVPIAVSAISPETLRNTGATDIRQLSQVAPSLLVSSPSSEAGAGGARIRGVGTVGENIGLEASVPTFIDGVYRSRAGTALSELGPVERVEVLRGPQGTLFGRNASAGLLSITTANPKDQLGGYAEGTYGNYNFYRLAGGITGPIGSTGVDFRLDGVYQKRDGFLQDVISGRRVNNRDRYLIRGKLRYEPTSNLSVLLIGDYTRQKEECCSATFLPTRNVTRAADGSYVISPSSVAALERSFVSSVPGAGNGQILDDTYARQVAITPGRNLRSDVKDWGGSGQIDWKLGRTSITSITAYRYNKYTSGQDSDFNNLDLLYRAGDGGRFARFHTFSQELRAQGTLFDSKLNWLVGGYYANEKLSYNDNLHFGQDYDRYSTLLGASGLGASSPALSQLFAATGFTNLNGFAQGFVNAQLPAGTPAATRAALVGAIAGQVMNTPSSGRGLADQYRQEDNNFALFTHNIFHVTDKLSLTLGARHTWDRKSLDTTLSADSQCGTYNANIARLQALAGSGQLGTASGIASGLANQVLAPLAALPCVINGVNGNFSGKRRESEWTGTAIISYKPTDRLLTYASISRGYKAGGFNLDRAPLFNPATRLNLPTANLGPLQFEPEKVDAFEVGGKYRGRSFTFNAALFYERFKSFQLNTFNGTSFIVGSIQGCKDSLGSTDSDQIAGNSPCANPRSGITSKGVELEASVYLVRDVTFSQGFTLADTKYRADLINTPDPSGNNSLPPALSLLPGSRLSLSSLYVVTGSVQWTPPIGSLRALAYVDYRYTSALNTGSDLFAEKRQTGVMVINARVGIGANNSSWSLEAWAQNLLNTDYSQFIFNATLQGSNTSMAQLASGQTTTQLFGAFLAEPRTYGVTLRKRF
ncbi:TonB-dependent receptor [Sphingomonas sp. TREG-RG-20F-R18-01]|uniref:TonB-dependent receptor n=1 Tax=Sphingomonas sp. TREG-RG-20F-R18-01 TaxID=2914982 RepID=UPI001F59C813|nr:TonB-dependent receptor [Sphingomonas sp. TREG-RG-20F-R18-01]